MHILLTISQLNIKMKTIRNATQEPQLIQPCLFVQKDLSGRNVTMHHERGLKSKGPAVNGVMSTFTSSLYMYDFVDVTAGEDRFLFFDPKELQEKAHGLQSTFPQEGKKQPFVFNHNHSKCSLIYKRIFNPQGDGDFIACHFGKKKWVISL